MEITPERLAACKQYMMIDHDEDDGLIPLILGGVDAYLEGAGVIRDVSPNLYDLVSFAMTLPLYEVRGAMLPQDVADLPAIRRMLVQMKLRAAYGGAAGGENDIASRNP